jgi:hypothetical protein
VDEITFERELEERLEMLESPAGDTMVVPDLPLADLLVAVIGLTLATIALLWWAY